MDPWREGIHVSERGSFCDMDGAVWIQQCLRCVREHVLQVDSPVDPTWDPMLLPFSHRFHKI